MHNSFALTKWRQRSSGNVELVSFRFRRRVSLELEVLALRHQLAVLHRQRPGRAWLGRGDRLLWGWLYRIWPRCLEVMVLVKAVTVVQWRRRGFRRFTSGRPARRDRTDKDAFEFVGKRKASAPLGDDAGPADFLAPLSGG
jgi:putative transposase